MGAIHSPHTQRSVAVTTFCSCCWLSSQTYSRRGNHQQEQPMVWSLLFCVRECSSAYFSWNHCIDRDSDINAERTRLMPKLFGKAFPHLNPLLWFIQIFLSVAHSRKLCWSKLQSYNIFHSTLSGIQQYFPFSRVCSISLRKLNFILPLVCKKSLVCDFS